jgi:hypothetical protein
MKIRFAPSASKNFIAVRNWFGVCIVAAIMLSFAALLTGCGSSTTTTVVAPSISLGSNNVVIAQDGMPVSVKVTIASTSAATVSVTGLPTGITGNYVADAGGLTGTLTLTGSTNAAVGAGHATISATANGASGSAVLNFVSAPVVKVASTVDTSLGINGHLQQFMSTSFQPASWNDAFFTTNTAAREATLSALGSQHMRLQPIEQAVPMVSNTGTAADWNFTTLDAIVQPVLSVGDNSPEFQIAIAPTWMDNGNGNLDIQNHLNDFAAYCANLVRYYNTGGFTWGGTHFQSASPHPIHWWGIFNEYNGNGLTTQQYVHLYNAVVPAMQAVDPTIQFSALEYSDYGLGSGGAGDPETALPIFFAAPGAGGVNAQVDVVSTHLYGSCNQKDSDTKVFATVPGFAANVTYFLQQMAKRPDLGNMQLWITENNVNADWSNNGMSECNPGQVYVEDPRGSDAYFAAWRPYVFSQVGKAGNQSLYHWDYDADIQYGEVDYSTGNIQLSYWVDQALEQNFPSTSANPYENILETTQTESTDIETLATSSTSGAVTVMVVDYAVQSPSDDNGAGVPRTVVLDLSTLGNFSSATALHIDATTSAANGPAAVAVTPEARMTVQIPGYGVAFITLKP